MMLIIRFYKSVTSFVIQCIDFFYIFCIEILNAKCIVVPLLLNDVFPVYVNIITFGFKR